VVTIPYIYVSIFTYMYIQEDIDVAESDPETPSPYTGKRGGALSGDHPEASMSESCTEVSISDRRSVVLIFFSMSDFF